jgi:hypothetical protein
VAGFEQEQRTGNYFHLKSGQSFKQWTNANTDIGCLGTRVLFKVSEQAGGVYRKLVEYC